MKINVIVNGKIGVMNLTHSTFIVEDLKAHICNKIGLDVDSYKLKIDFNGDSIELVQTKSNPSFPSNQHDPYREVKRLEKEILSKIKEKYPEKAEWIKVDESIKGSLKISVFFNDVGEGHAITYFGESESDYNKPLHPQLELRRSAVYKILKSYLGAN